MFQPVLNLEYVYTHYGDALFGICRRYTSCYEEAEDVFHDGLLHIEKNLHQYKGNGSFEGWCKRLVVSVAAGVHRKRKTETNMLNKYMFDDDILIEQPNFEKERTQVFDADFDGDELLEAVMALPEKCRLVFNLYVFEDLKHKDISKQLNITVGTSKSQLTRARRLIHADLHNRAIKKKRRKMVCASILIVMKDPYAYIDGMVKDRVVNVVNKAPVVDLANIKQLATKSVGKVNSFRLFSKWNTIIVAGAVITGSIVGLVLDRTDNNLIEKIEPRMLQWNIQIDTEPDLNNISRPKEVIAVFKSEPEIKIYKKVVHYDTVVQKQRVFINDTL